MNKQLKIFYTYYEADKEAKRLSETTSNECSVGAIVDNRVWYIFSKSNNKYALLCDNNEFETKRDLIYTLDDEYLNFSNGENYILLDEWVNKYLTTSGNYKEKDQEVRFKINDKVYHKSLKQYGEFKAHDKVDDTACYVEFEDI